MGEKGYYDDLVIELPIIRGFTWLDRPIDMEKFELVIRSEISGTGMEKDRKSRILIVDDDPSFAKMTREWLKDKYRVDIVTNGMQAISFLLKIPEDDKVNMVLLDYEMPVVNGPQVFQMLKQEPQTADIPVIFLTGNGNKEAVSKVLELKPDGYVLKSTPKDELIKYLRSKIR